MTNQITIVTSEMKRTCNKASQNKQLKNDRLQTPED